MAKITFKITAMTDVGLVRTNNEDNFVAISDLNVTGSTWKSDEVCELSEHGALLVVADGMGGMNAGEIASEIAISTVKEIFSENITEKVTESDESIIAFMNNAIVTADKRIKSEGKRRSEAKGMGTTIVIAWLYKGLLYVSWCGDSRAYVFNEDSGLKQITKDHSYVQELVDSGVVRPEDAFDFPESNVITRCLSHSSLKAVPENISKPYPVAVGDIILLCTDGLSGMIRDKQIAAIISDNIDSMGNCASALIDAAKAASGADNITVDLCQIISIDNEVSRITAKLSDLQLQPIKIDKEPEISSDENGKGLATVPKAGNNMNNTVFLSKKKTNWFKKAIIATLIVIIVAVGAYYGYKYYFGNQPNVKKSENVDTSCFASENIDTSRQHREDASNDSLETGEEQSTVFVM